MSVSLKEENSVNLLQLLVDKTDNLMALVTLLAVVTLWEVQSDFHLDAL